MTRPQARHGRGARLLLLLSTVFGLAMMHTLGHSGMQMTTAHLPDHLASAMTVVDSAAFTAVAPVVMVAAPACAGDSCHSHGAMDVWSVCLAVLSAFVAVAVAVALMATRRVRRWVVAAGHCVAAAIGCGAPPPRGVGLTLASAAVLRT